MTTDPAQMAANSQPSDPDRSAMVELSPERKKSMLRLCKKHDLERKFTVINIPDQRRTFAFNSFNSASQWLARMGRLEREMKDCDLDCDLFDPARFCRTLTPSQISKMRSILSDIQTFQSEYPDHIPLRFGRWTRRTERILGVTQT